MINKPFKDIVKEDIGEIFNRCRETEFNSLQTTSGYLIFT